MSISSVVRPPDRGLDRLAGPVEQEGVADVRERAGDGEGDVALPAVRLVVRRLVDPGRVEQEPDREREDADDQRVTRAPEPARRAVGIRRRPSATRARRLGGRLGVDGRLDRAGLVGLGQERREQRWRRVGHQNWK